MSLEKSSKAFGADVHEFWKNANHSWLDDEALSTKAIKARNLVCGFEKCYLLKMSGLTNKWSNALWNAYPSYKVQRTMTFIDKNT